MKGYCTDCEQEVPLFLDGRGYCGHGRVIVKKPLTNHYRKKPVVVEAHRVGEPAWPESFWEAIRTNKIVFQLNYVEVHTLEGVMRAEVGDWIIRGVAGEFYPCKPEIFEATYERLDP